MTDKQTNALTYQPNPVEINGVKYKRRRLGILDEMALVDLVFKSGAKLNVDKEALENLGAAEMAGHLFSLLTIALDDVLDFLRGTLVDFPLDIEEMKNPDLFPLGSLEAIVESIAEDEDVASFFGHVRRLIKLKDKIMGTSPSRSKSGQSKKRRAGATKKS